MLLFSPPCIYMLVCHVISTSWPSLSPSVCFVLLVVSLSSSFVSSYFSNNAHLAVLPTADVFLLKVSSSSLLSQSSCL